MVASDARMKVGVNYPWWHYGWDFGVGPWGMRRAWEASLVDELRALKALGIHAVRWFVLGDGLTYGTGAAVPTEDPTRRWYGQPQWRFIPPGADGTRAILEDVRVLLECFRKANEGGDGVIGLVPVVADFHLFHPGNTETGLQGTPGGPKDAPPRGFVKSGRSDIPVDPGKTARFIEYFLAPLVALASEPTYRPFLHSLDLMNEPEWCTDDGSHSPLRTVPLPAMKRFLRACADTARGRLPTTVGFADVETLSKWNVSALGLDLWQFHYYAKPRVIPRASDFPCRTLVGELATATDTPPVGLRRLLHKLWLSSGGLAWPELGGVAGDQRLAARLHLLAEKGYHECFVWSLHATDRATRWDDTARSDLARFIRGA